MGKFELDRQELDRYIASVRPDFERMLGDLVEVPTISADPVHRDDVRRGAELGAEYLRDSGASADVVETPGNPVVVGEFAAGASDPVVTVYNHLDVQPAQEPEWTRDPFSFLKVGDRYQGRGCTDDKGPALTALLAAAYVKEAGIPLNIRFLWELEEEIGSPNFEHFIRSRPDELKTGSVVVSDTVWLSRDKPSLAYGLRGLQTARLVLETAEKDAHSGLTGGAARNPIGELCEVIGRCYDARTGTVHIPGFYDDVEPPSGEELEGFLSSGFAVDGFMAAHGLRGLRTMDRREVLERIWCRPTFEVHGISGGYQGPGIKTVVPPRCEVKLSMRLVPNQDPVRVLGQLREFVGAINPDVEVVGEGPLRPFLGDRHGPHYEAARRAVRFGFGREAALTREGGSIGAVVTMQEHLDAPIVFIGLSLPEHSYHGPNEYFDWGQASGGIRTLAAYFAEVASIPSAVSKVTDRAEA